MKSLWFEYKEEILALRRQGTSMTTIHRKYGIPKSTLSGWLKEVKLTEAQRTRLLKNSEDGWKKARLSANQWHRAQKDLRLQKANFEAIRVLNELPRSIEVLELALAMLYFGEGSKDYSTKMGASDPFMLCFFLSSMEKVYDLNRDDFRYDLHLRDDHDEQEMKKYWANELGISVDIIGYVVKDKRTIGKPTKNNYPGVCLISVGQIHILRRLKAIYTVYCTEVIKGD